MVKKKIDNTLVASEWLCMTITIDLLRRVSIELSIEIVRGFLI